LANHNRSPLYDRHTMLALGERLLRSDGAVWAFYAPDSVEELLKELR
jgi:hypothetical protein